MVIIGLIYSKYQDNKYNEIIEFGVRSLQKVVNQTCRYSPKLQSSITINVQHKDYNIQLSSGVCEKYPVNSYIPVFYLKKYDEYVYKHDKRKSNRNFLLLVLLIMLLPWSYAFNSFYSKHQF